jgi:hypothetical protein
VTALFLDEYNAACLLLEDLDRIERTPGLSDERAAVLVAEARRQFHAACEQAAKARKCRVCGCTDDDCEECTRRTGFPCTWIEDDLCSACAGPTPTTERSH